MNQLLEQLREKDPETYERLQIGFESLDIYIEDDKFHVIVDETIAAAGKPAVWIIQAVLQEAITSRGHALILSYDCDPDSPKTWEAEICDSENAKREGSGRGGSPAGALLKAYVEAITCE
jgi:hypothetical protein